MKNIWKYSPLIGAFFCLLSSCSEENKSAKKEDTSTPEKESQKGEYKVTGTIEGLTSDTVFLIRLEKNSMQQVGKTVASEDGTFSFEGEIESPQYYNVRFNEDQSVNFILDNEAFSFTADANAENYNIQIEGSKTNQDLVAFSNYFSDLVKERKKLESDYKRLTATNKRSDSIRIIFDQLSGMENKRDEFARHFIDSIFPSKAIFFIAPILNSEPHIDYQAELSKKLLEEYPDLSLAQNYRESMESIVAQRDEMEAKQKNNPVAEGKMAPAISLPDPEGKIHSLDDLKGNYVLLDFWASWCGPCRAENPNLVKTFNKYKSKNFKIFSVSLDADKNGWLKAIQKDNLDHEGWYHVSDLKHWQSEVVSSYQIQGIPFALLLNPKGEIIAKNLRGSALEAKLKEVF